MDSDLVLVQETAHHIRHVLRKKPGDRLHVSDGVAACYGVMIEAFTKEEVRCRIEEQFPLPHLPPPRVLLLISLPKGNRMDWLVQKATEVGVAEIKFLSMERSVREIKRETSDHWMRRWEKIALAAAGQSGRTEFPVLHPPRSFTEVLPSLKDVSLKFFADPEEGRTFYDRFSLTPLPERIAIVVGPEGGITKVEKELLLENDFASLTLGQTILRVETAGVLAIAMARYEWQRSKQVREKQQL